MYPLTHFLVAFIISITFAKFTFNEALITGIIAILIDLDHYVEYIIHKHKFNIKEAWNNATIKHLKYERSWLHRTKGLLIVTLILALISFVDFKLFLMLAIAYYSHWILDLISLTKISRSYKFSFLRYVVNIIYAEIVIDILLILIIFSSIQS